MDKEKFKEILLRRNQKFIENQLEITKGKVKNAKGFGCIIEAARINAAEVCVSYAEEELLPALEAIIDAINKKQNNEIKSPDR